MSDIELRLKVAEKNIMLLLDIQRAQSEKNELLNKKISLLGRLVMEVCSAVVKSHGDKNQIKEFEELLKGIG